MNVKHIDGNHFVLDINAYELMVLNTAVQQVQGLCVIRDAEQDALVKIEEQLGNLQPMDLFDVYYKRVLTGEIKLK